MTPAPTEAEADPLSQGRYGGTLLTRYLDPPHMDFNRTLSCTINTTHDYTKNTLTRLALGSQANIVAVDIEPDLAGSREVTDDATRFTFKLRQNAKFHNVAPVNGRALTSDDVLVSVERYRSGARRRTCSRRWSRSRRPTITQFRHSLGVSTPGVLVHIAIPNGAFR